MAQKRQPSTETAAATNRQISIMTYNAAGDRINDSVALKFNETPTRKKLITDTCISNQKTAQPGDTIWIDDDTEREIRTKKIITRDDFPSIGNQDIDNAIIKRLFPNNATEAEIAPVEVLALVFRLQDVYGANNTIFTERDRRRLPGMPHYYRASRAHVFMFDLFDKLDAPEGFRRNFAECIYRPVRTESIYKEEAEGMVPISFAESYPVPYRDPYVPFLIELAPENSFNSERTRHRAELNVNRLPLIEPDALDTFVKQVVFNGQDTIQVAPAEVPSLVLSIISSLSEEREKRFLQFRRGYLPTASGEYDINHARVMIYALLVAMGEPAIEYRERVLRTWYREEQLEENGEFVEIQGIRVFMNAERTTKMISLFGEDWQKAPTLGIIGENRGNYRRVKGHFPAWLGNFNIAQQLRSYQKNGISVIGLQMLTYWLEDNLDQEQWERINRIGNRLELRARQNFYASTLDLYLIDVGLELLKKQKKNAALAWIIASRMRDDQEYRQQQGATIQVKIEAQEALHVGEVVHIVVDGRESFTFELTEQRIHILQKLREARTDFSSVRTVNVKRLIPFPHTFGPLENYVIHNLFGGKRTAEMSVIDAVSFGFALEDAIRRSQITDSRSPAILNGKRTINAMLPVNPTVTELHAYMHGWLNAIDREAARHFALACDNSTEILYPTVVSEDLPVAKGGNRNIQLDHSLVYARRLYCYPYVVDGSIVQRVVNDTERVVLPWDTELIRRLGFNRAHIELVRHNLGTFIAGYQMTIDGKKQTSIFLHDIDVEAQQEAYGRRESMRFVPVTDYFTIDGEDVIVAPEFPVQSIDGWMLPQLAQGDFYLTEYQLFLLHVANLFPNKTTLVAQLIQSWVNRNARIMEEMGMVAQIVHFVNGATDASRVGKSEDNDRRDDL